MLDDTRTKLRAISQELQQELTEEIEWFRDRGKSANAHIEFFGKMRDDKDTSSDARLLASYITVNECNTMISLAQHYKLMNTCARFIVQMEISLSIIQKELTRLQQPSVITSDDVEKIKLLEKDSTKLKREVRKMRPYVETLKEGIKKEQKWRREHR